VFSCVSFHIIVLILFSIQL